MVVPLQTEVSSQLLETVWAFQGANNSGRGFFPPIGDQSMVGSSLVCSVPLSPITASSVSLFQSGAACGAHGKAFLRPSEIHLRRIRLANPRIPELPPVSRDALISISSCNSSEEESSSEWFVGSLDPSESISSYNGGCAVHSFEQEKMIVVKDSSFTPWGHYLVGRYIVWQLVHHRPRLGLPAVNDFPLPLVSTKPQKDQVSWL